VVNCVRHIFQTGICQAGGYFPEAKAIEKMTALKFE